MNYLNNSRNSQNPSPSQISVQSNKDRSFSSYTAENNNIDLRYKDVNKSEDSFSEYQENSIRLRKYQRHEDITNQANNNNSNRAAATRQNQGKISNINTNNNAQNNIKQQQPISKKYNYHHQRQYYDEKPPEPYLKMSYSKSKNQPYARYYASNRSSSAVSPSSSVYKHDKQYHRFNQPLTGSGMGKMFNSSTYSPKTTKIGAFGVVDQLQYQQYYNYALNKLNSPSLYKNNKYGNGYGGGYVSGPVSPSCLNKTVANINYHRNDISNKIEDPLRNNRSFSISLSQEKNSIMHPRPAQHKTSTNLTGQKSEFWNGSRFDYLSGTSNKKIGTFNTNNTNENINTNAITNTNTNIRQTTSQFNQIIDFDQQNKRNINTITITKNKAKPLRTNYYYQRNINSGMIINKKQPVIVTDRDNQPQFSFDQKDLQFKDINNQQQQQKQPQHHQSSQNDTYIRIQEDQSSGIKQSNQKQTQKDINVIKQKQQLFICENEMQTLKQENLKLKETIKQKNTQLQSVHLSRLQQNNEFDKKLQRLRCLFQEQKQRLVNSYEQEIQSYKKNCNIVSHRRHALIDRQVSSNANGNTSVIAKRCSPENDQSHHLLKHKENYQIQKLNVKIKVLEEALEQNCLQKENLQKQITLLEEKIKKQGETHKQAKWVSSFLRVFEDMVRKLPIQDVDQNWESKKVVIVGWKVVKRVIEKAVKIGIKMPKIITSETGMDEDQQPSIMTLNDHKKAQTAHVSSSVSNRKKQQASFKNNKVQFAR